MDGIKQPLIVDDTRNRAAYTRVIEITNKLNEIFGASILVQPGYLLSEVLLVDGTTNYRFPLLANDIAKGDFKLSYGVNINDVFLGFQRELTVDNRPALNSALIEPQRYYNKLVFTAANTTTPAHIQAIFNAVWKYSVGSKTYIQQQFTREDLKQPRTQQSSSQNWAEYDGSKLQQIDPYLLVSGKATVYLDLNILQPGFAAAGIGGTYNVLSWYMLGVTLQNGAGYSRFYSGDLSVEAYFEDYVKLNQQITDRKKWNPLPYSDSFGNMQ